MVFTPPVFLLVLLGVIGVGTAAVVIAELALGRPRAILEERRRADLRRRAPLDKRAAKELRDRLLQDLARQEAVRRDLERNRAANSKDAALLRDIERAEQATRNEIMQIEMWIGILR
jgi:hypothetical protein